MCFFFFYITVILSSPNCCRCNLSPLLLNQLFVLSFSRKIDNVDCTKFSTAVHRANARWMSE